MVEICLGSDLSARFAWSHLSLIPTLLPAQGASGRILGRVADPTGAVLSGAKVTLINEATGISRDAQTNDSGDYSFVDGRSRYLHRPV